MDIEEAKSRLEMAERKLRDRDAEREHTLQEWWIAEAARGSNRVHYRLHRRHGDGYMQMFRDAKDRALSEYHSAREELEKAKVDYERATKDR